MRIAQALLLLLVAQTVACSREPGAIGQAPSNNEPLAASAATTQFVLPMAARDGPEGTFVYTV